MQNHVDECGCDSIVGSMEAASLLRSEITTAGRELKPTLRFGSLGLDIAQLADEGGSIATFTPYFGKVGTDRTRGTTDLIGERVALAWWKGFACFENVQRQLERALVNVEIVMLTALRAM